MPGITQYVLSGGPCDGKHGDLTPAIDSSGRIVCKNHVYKRVEPVQVQDAREVFKDSGVVAKPPPTPNAPRAHHGWGDLRHSINHNMPAGLRAAQKSTAAALRELGHGRKVRR